jgi:Domain of unknown function (DUF4824)
VKNISLAGGVAIIVVANAFALIHAARNRAGSPDGELTLSNRELTYSSSPSDEDSEVTLDLGWLTGEDVSWMGYGSSPKWLDQEKLQRLGFDCRVNPSAEAALRFYDRQRPRRAFVALEYDGPAWRNWLAAYNRAAEERAKRGSGVVQNQTPDQTHLVAIDADVDARALRARNPNRSNVIIMPAVVAIGLEPYPDPGRKSDPKTPVRIVGRIRPLASSIHVPRPLSEGFQHRDQGKNLNARALSYTVRVRYGSLLEPWVTGVEFGQ